MPGLRPRGALQQHQFGQLLGTGQLAPGQQLWRTHRHHLFAEQLHASGPRPSALAIEEHHISRALQQGERLHLVANVQVDIAVPFAKTFQMRDQPAHAKTRLSGYFQYLGLFAVGEHIAAGHIYLGEDLVDLRQVQAAGRGKLQAPADAQEQVVAQHVFQLRHLLADRALGQVQFFGGTGKTQMAGCSFKALQGGHGGYQAF